LSAEAPVEFLKPLTDQRVKEYETASFECEVSKPGRQPTWRCGDVTLEPSDRVEMKSEGQKHTLTISNAELTDASVYTVMFEDSVQSSAGLIVDGKHDDTFKTAWIQLFLLQKFPLTSSDH
jgi:hypothetical protein